MENEPTGEVFLVGSIEKWVRLPRKLHRGVSPDSAWKTNPPGGVFLTPCEGKFGGFGARLQIQRRHGDRAPWPQGMRLRRFTEAPLHVWRRTFIAGQGKGAAILL